MDEFKITKGDRATIPYRLNDVDNLNGYSFIWTLSAEEDGAPLLTKTSGIGGIIHDIALKNIDVNLEVADFDYSSTIEPGTYYCQLIAIYDDGISGEFPRTIDKRAVIVTHSQYYKHL